MFFESFLLNLGLVASTFVGLLILSIYFLSHIYYSTSGMQKSRGIVTPFGMPPFGVGMYFYCSIEELFSRLTALAYCAPKSAQIGMVEIKPFRYIALLAAEAVEVILNSNKHITKSIDYRFIRPWLGQGLITARGSKWQTHRKMLTPTFHFKILEEFMHVFNEQSHILIKKLHEKAESKSPLNVIDYITLCTLDVICETAMGKKMHAQSNGHSEYVKALFSLTETIQQRQVRVWLHPRWIFNLSPLGRRQRKCLDTIHGFVRSVIKERKAEAKVVKRGEVEDDIIGKKRRFAFLDLLLQTAESSGTLTDQDLIDEVNTFMFAGHDTTAMAICWTLYLLAVNPAHQDKVYEELQDIFGDSDRDATMDDLTNMKYLEMCMKEALRLYPSVPMIARKAEADIEILPGQVAPKNSTLLIIPYIVHRHEATFPNPEFYDPERFLTDNIARRHPFAYVPFSAGPRNCIGQRFALMEEKVVVSTVLRNYKLESDMKREDIVLMADIILRPKGGLPIKFTPRK